MTIRHPWTRTLAAGVATFALAASGQVADPTEVDAAPIDGRIVYVVERSTPHPSPVTVRMTAARAAGESTFFGMVGLSGLGADLEVEPLQMGFGGEGVVPHVHAPGASVSCDDVACAGSVGILSTRHAHDPSSDGLELDRILLVAETEQNTLIEIDGSGWSLRRVTDIDFETSRRSSTTGAGAYAVHTGVEVFLSAELESTGQTVAMAVPPCADSQVSYGSGLLSGGRTQSEATCSIDNFSYASGVADGATTWRFEGTAAGLVSNGVTRLLVAEAPGPVPCADSSWVLCSD